MPFTLTLPEVGETVTEGTIERWLKQPGETVAKYEPIVEINTDKVNVELPSPVSGTVLEHLAQEGDTVPIGAPLCTIEAVAGEVPADITPPAAAEPATTTARSDGTADGEGTSAHGEGTRTMSVAPAPAGESKGGPNRATPRVRKLAADLGVDLAAVTGTGPGGRILEEDVRAATPVAEGPSPPPAAPAATGEDESVPLTAVRKTIAQRMSDSALNTPVAWLVVEADVTGLVALRNARKEEFAAAQGTGLTYLPFAAHAVCGALAEHPYLNASWAGDHIVLKKHINLGIAAATERGLVVPVIPGADRLSVTGLALAISALGEKARDNKLQLTDVQGGTFTLDNTGAFGSIISQPIINTGQAAIISLEAVRRHPVAVADDAIAVRSIVNLCLSFDHRILDGHQAGAFLQTVRSRLEAFAPGTSLD
jgi:2-oxoisovalerate dehydrogenase E2 component (dihydrolipoyl transacylase)